MKQNFAREMMIELDKIKRVFFVGIGGIGMSALARYFSSKGLQIAGYDSTRSPLTDELAKEGIQVHFDDDINLIPKEFTKHLDETLVIYTPAIPSDHKQLNFFKSNSYGLAKRAKALGLIAKEYSTAAVAGTHGKTSTSTLLAHLLVSTPDGCNAFLGGISKNFRSNLVLDDRGGKRLVVEADEFDRSFLNLNPQLAIITSIDADHLDIYNTHKEVKEAFATFTSNITSGGILIIKKGLEKIAAKRRDIKVYTYSSEEVADFYVKNISNEKGIYTFDLISPFGTTENITLGVLGRYNIENAVAASAAALVWGMNQQTLKEALKTFKGISRRFDLQHNGKSVLIDDYAHHPEEIRAAISSVRDMFPHRKVTGIFQPHLYSRTKDFAPEFAESLSMLDELILLDIYPAREQPIPGVTSELVFEKVKCKSKHLCRINELEKLVLGMEFDVLITMGAGNIDREVLKLVKILKEREAV
jgi:UDP-N-acetylmuramate--alanine ligase